MLQLYFYYGSILNFILTVLMIWNDLFRVGTRSCVSMTHLVDMLIWYIWNVQIERVIVLQKQSQHFISRQSVSV